MAAETVVLKTRQVFWKDLAERTLSTFIQGAAAVLLAAPMTNWQAPKLLAASAVVGGVAAVLAMVKGIISSGMTNSNSASALGKI